MNPVEIVTIKNKIPLFKNEEEANAVELIELEEVGYELVAGKNLYEIGDTAVLIQPDYCVSDIPLFESFIRPINWKTGLPDEYISMLGRVDGQPRRIRAKKFTLSKEPNGNAVYSNGILLPEEDVANYLKLNYLKKSDNLTDALGITKYEELEHTNKYGIKTGLTEGKFPEGLYKTDEDNILKVINEIEFPITLVGTEKVDGSSITIGVTPKIPEGFICSRNLRKKLTLTKSVGKRDKKWYEYLMFWKQPDLNVYVEVENDDDFVKHGKPYLDILLNKIPRPLNSMLVLRGELNGGKLKGSGNKNNPASKEKANIKFFGVDTFSECSNAEKIPYKLFDNIMNHLDFPRVKEVFVKEFASKEDLFKECNDYFKNNMVEGIIVRTLDSKFSAKIMNLEYDSKK